MAIFRFRWSTRNRHGAVDQRTSNGRRENCSLPNERVYYKGASLGTIGKHGKMRLESLLAGHLLHRTDHGTSEATTWPHASPAAAHPVVRSLSHSFLPTTTGEIRCRVSCRHSFIPPPRVSEAEATGSHHASPAEGQPSLDPSRHKAAESDGEGDSHPCRR